MVLPFRALLDPAPKKIDLRLWKRRCMIRHAGLWIRRCHAGDKFRSPRISGHDGSPSRFARPERFFAKEKRNAVLLPHSPVARHAILIKDWADVAAEVHFVARPQIHAKCCQKQAARNEQNNDGPG
jgi:hypothetical protein